MGFYGAFMESMKPGNAERKKTRPTTVYKLYVSSQGMRRGRNQDPPLYINFMSPARECGEEENKPPHCINFHTYY
jgi:hypothetical protein